MRHAAAANPWSNHWRVVPGRDIFVGTITRTQPLAIRIPLALVGFTSNAGAEMADQSGPRGIVTLVCMTCGAEKFYDDSAPQSATCDKCGSTVFRTFATPTEPDDASIATLEAQARSIAFGDSSPDTRLGDLRDLDAR